MEVYGQNFGGTGSVSGSPVEWVGVEVETGIEGEWLCLHLNFS